MPPVDGLFVRYLYDDYGFARYGLILAILMASFLLVIWVSRFLDKHENLVMFFARMYCLVLLYAFLSFVLINSNIYELIPDKGTNNQKVNLKRCITNKEFDLDNIKGIMKNCRLKTGIERVN